MINIPESYLEDEVLDGFYVPSISKRAWAATLVLLDAFDSLCLKHGIIYHADWGTMIGAVRHHGFIPWDDDLDLVIHRNELNKIRALADELPEGVSIHDFNSSDYHWKFTVNLVNTEHMNFEPGHLKKNFAFPYIAALDIFVMDNYADDEEFEEARAEAVKRILNAADAVDVTAGEQRQLLAISKIADDAYRDFANKALDKYCKKEGVQITLPDVIAAGIAQGDIKRRLYNMAVSVMSCLNGVTTPFVSQMIPHGVYHKRFYNREIYENSVRIPFEFGEIAMPLKYDELLNGKYGNYMKFYYGGSAHTYPCFEAQKQNLNTDMEYEPLYVFNPEDLKREAAGKSGSLRETAIEYLEYLTNFNGNLMEAQEVAVNFGGLVDAACGDGTETVTALENYCEGLYRISETEPESEAEAEAVSRLFELIDAAAFKIKEEIIERETVLLVACRAKDWQALKPYYDREIEAGTRVLVVVSPYYYKNYDRSFKEMQEESELFPDDVVLTPYDKLNLELLAPDRIYIQNPYDECNMAVSLHPYFYARNLRKYTDELIYVPCFSLKDFGADLYPQNYNMKYYVTVPGVVLADKVVCESPVLRERYLEQLIKMAAGVAPEAELKQLFGQRLATSEEFMGCGIKAEKQEQNCEGVVPKKQLFFYTSFSTLYSYGEQYIKKLRSNIEIYKENSDKLSILWYVDPVILSDLPRLNKKLFDEFTTILTTTGKTNSQFIKIADSDLKPGEAEAACAAYYGDSSVFVKEFVAAGKPVMLANPEI